MYEKTTCFNQNNFINDELLYKDYLPNYHNYFQTYKWWFTKNAKLMERLSYWKIGEFA